MKFFDYTAKGKNGKIQRGTIEAIDEKQSAGMLREKGLFIISIKPKKQLFLGGAFKKVRGVSGREKTSFTRMLATMLSTGLPLIDALSNLAEEADNAFFRQIIEEIIRDVQGGRNLSRALSRYPEVFPNLYINMVKAGEASGKMDESLLNLADTLEKEEEFRGKIKGAMVYPAIVVSAMLGIGGLMIVFVIPKIAAVYKEFGAQLPLPTKILIGLSDLVINFWWVLGVLLFGLVFALRSLEKTPAGKKAIGNLGYRLPVFGKLNQEVTIALFARTLGALVGSGIAILEALKIVGETLGSNIYSDFLKEAGQQIERGLPLSLPLRQSGIFPTIVSQMVAIGEETGTLDESLMRLAAFFEANAERKVKTLTTALEPFMILMMGIGVGGLAISVLMPMFNLVNVIK